LNKFCSEGKENTAQRHPGEVQEQVMVGLIRFLKRVVS
jgi:uncharacterized protein YaeQ